jgi:hypothetical protein
MVAEVVCVRQGGLSFFGLPEDGAHGQEHAHLRRSAVALSAACWGKGMLGGQRRVARSLLTPRIAQDLTVIKITFVKIDQTRALGAKVGCCK